MSDRSFLRFSPEYERGAVCVPLLEQVSPSEGASMSQLKPLPYCSSGSAGPWNRIWTAERRERKKLRCLGKTLLSR